MLTRIFVSVLFIPLLIIIFFNGGFPLLVLLAIFSVLAAVELRKMLAKKYPPISPLIIPLCGITFFVTALYQDYALSSFVLVILLITGYDVFSGRIENSVIRTALSIFIIAYIPVMFALAYRIRCLDNGNLLLLMLIITIWITDTFAYFIGMLLGRHRGITKVSPQKSLEGFIAGAVFAFIGAYIIHLCCSSSVSLKEMLLIAFSASIAGQFGDLVESLIKRDVGVKDSSKIIPGHGGILDRFDSFLVAAPVFYFLYKLLI